MLLKKDLSPQMPISQFVVDYSICIYLTVYFSMEKDLQSPADITSTNPEREDYVSYTTWLIIQN